MKNRNWRRKRKYTLSAFVGIESYVPLDLKNFHKPSMEDGGLSAHCVSTGADSNTEPHLHLFVVRGD